MPDTLRETARGIIALAVIIALGVALYFIVGPPTPLQLESLRGAECRQRCAVGCPSLDSECVTHCVARCMATVQP